MARWQDCYCRECLKMDLSDVSRYDREDRYCTHYHKYFNKNDRACSNGFEYDESKREVSGCYITTIVNNILGMPDNGATLVTLRKFRDNYMLNHPELYVMLIEYDVVGPKIANAIINDPNKKLIARESYYNYILPTTLLINNKEYDKALNKYQELTDKLKNFYKIDTTIHRKINIKIKTLGKSRV